jgi:hypothetical protein
VIYEWYETNPHSCTEILLKLSQVTLHGIAQSVLELLSNLTELPKLIEKHFTQKEFITVSAIALKYIDPFK